MGLAEFIATLVIVLFLVTVVMAVGSYGAYKLRERRRPVAARAADATAEGESRYFERVDAAALDGEP